jgi:hypothetical protein
MTRRILAAVMALALVGVTMPVPVQAARAAQATGQIGGTASSAQGQPLANYTIQLRNVQTGQLVGTTTSNATGAFSFTSLNPGNFVIEIVNSSGTIIGTSASVTLAAGAVVSGVAVAGSALGALGAAGAAAAGGAFFASTAGIVVITAVGAGVAGGIYAATNNASPSR